MDIGYNILEKGQQLQMVVTETEWVPKLIQRNEGGIVVPQDDVHAFTRAMLELASDPQRRAQLGARNRERARDRFSWPGSARKLLDVYERLAA